MLMDARAPEQIKNPYIAALITAYVGIFRLESPSIEQQQKYWNFIRNETLLETNVYLSNQLAQTLSDGFYLFAWEFRSLYY